MAEHWCKEHKQAFFKKGAMKGFAHPILDDDGEKTGEWCNEPKDESPKEKPHMPEPNGKNRAFALSYAKDIAVARIMMGGDMSTLKVIDVAKTFELYLDGIEFESKKEP